MTHKPFGTENENKKKVFISLKIRLFGIIKYIDMCKVFYCLALLRMCTHKINNFRHPITYKTHPSHTNKHIYTCKSTHTHTHINHTVV